MAKETAVAATEPQVKLSDAGKALVAAGWRLFFDYGQHVGYQVPIKKKEFFNDLGQVVILNAGRVYEEPEAVALQALFDESTAIEAKRKQRREQEEAKRRAGRGLTAT